MIRNNLRALPALQAVVAFALVFSMFRANTVIAQRPPSVIADVRFSSDISANAWVRDVGLQLRARHDFRVSLTPEYNIDGTLVGWVAGVYRMSDLNRNLLETSSEWRGLEPFHLMAPDFAKGIAHSQFGPNRSIVIDRTGHLLRLQVVRAVVGKASSGTVTFKTLEIHVEVF